MAEETGEAGGGRKPATGLATSLVVAAPRWRTGTEIDPKRSAELDEKIKVSLDYIRERDAERAFLSAQATALAEARFGATKASGKLSEAMRRVQRIKDEMQAEIKKSKNTIPAATETESGSQKSFNLLLFTFRLRYYYL